MSASQQHRFCSSRSSGRRFACRPRGLVTVELALILPLFLLLLFATLDLSRLFFTQITLQHAMREAGRFGVTGERLPNPSDPLSLQSRLESIRQVVEQHAVGVSVNPGDIRVSSVNGGADNAGGPGDTFTISLAYRFEFVTPLVGRLFDDGSHSFTVATSFRNEPFPPEAAP